MPGTRTDIAVDSGPGWLPVAATAVAQIVWLVAVFYAWVIAIVVIGYSGGLFGTGADSVEGRMLLSTIGAFALAPLPTVAFVLSQRNRRGRASRARSMHPVTLET